MILHDTYGGRHVTGSPSLRAYSTLYLPHMNSTDQRMDRVWCHADPVFSACRHKHSSDAFRIQRRQENCTHKQDT